MDSNPRFLVWFVMVAESAVVLRSAAVLWPDPAGVQREREISKAGGRGQMNYSALLSAHRSLFESWL